MITVVAMAVGAARTGRLRPIAEGVGGRIGGLRPIAEGVGGRTGRLWPIAEGAATAVVPETAAACRIVPAAGVAAARAAVGRTRSRA